jgi:amidohydrolase
MLFLGVDGGDRDAAGRTPGLHSPRFLPADDAVRQAALALLGGYLGAAGMLGPVPPPRV